MSEFIEFLSPQALAQLKEADAIVTDLATKIAAINNFKAPNTPSGGDTAVKKMTTEYEKQAQTIARINELQKQSAQRLSQVGTESQGMFSKMGNGLKSVIQLFGVYSAAMLAHRAIMGTIGIGTKLSDDLAQLSIYLNNSKKAADEVFDSLKKIKTRTSLSDLLGLAEIIAKKGVAQNEIAGITQALDNMFLVMGPGLGNKEEATASIIKLITIFNTDGKITADRVRDVGASMQYLTTTGVATADYLIDFSERLGAVRGITQQTMPQILGLGAGFEQLGITSGVASTAIGQVIKKMFTDVPKYAKQAGIAVGEFKYLLETDSTEAFLRYSKGLRETSKDSEGLAIALKNAQFVGQRVGSVVVEAGINYELLSKKVKGATDSLIEHSKQVAAASLKQDTFAATLDNIKRKFEEVISSTTAQDTFSNIAVGVFKLVKAILSIPFDAVVAGLISWATYKSILNKVIIENSVLQTVNNLKTMGRVATSLLARTGILGEAAAYNASNLAMTAKIELAAIEIKNHNILIIAKRLEITAIEQTIVATEAEAIARASKIAAIETEILALEGLILTEEAVIIETEAMTAAVASTGFGAIAIAIGLAVYALYEFITAESEAERKAKDILALTDKNAKQLADNAKILEAASQKRIRINKEENDILAKGNSDLNNKLADDNHKFQKDELSRTTAYYQNVLNIAIKKEKDLENLLKNTTIIKPKMGSGVRAGEVLNQNEIINQKNALTLIEKTLITRGQEIVDYTERLRTAKAAEVNFIRGNENPELLNDKTGGNAAKKERLALNFKEVESEYNLKIAILERKKAENVDDDEKSYEQRLAMRLEFSKASLEIIDAQLQKEYALNELRRKEDFDKNDLALKNKDISFEQHEINKNDILKTFINKNKTAETKTSEVIRAIQLSDLAFWQKIQYKKEDENLKLNKLITEGEITKYKRIVDNEKNTLLVRQAAFEKYIQLEKDLLLAQEQSDLARAKARGASKDELDSIVQSYQNAIDALNNIKSPKLLAIEQIEKQMRGFVDGFASKAGLSTTFDILQDGLEKYGENWKAKTVMIMESVQEMYNFISSMSQENFDAEYGRLEKQKDIALAFAGDSASARAEIEQQYEQRRKQIAKREAKAKKEQAIFNIGIDTAQAIIATLAKTPPPAGLPLAAFVAAIGAIQISMVASQNIPQYWTGTDNAEGGLAWTQERGREIITDSQGRIKSTGSDKGAELTMLSKGDKVFNAEKSAMMFDNSLNSMLLNNGIVMPKIEVSMDTQILGSKLDKLSDTIASKESFSITRDAKGERIYQRNQNERKELLNNILNVRTYGV